MSVATRRSDHAAPLDGPPNTLHPLGLATALESDCHDDERVRAEMTAFFDELDAFGAPMRAEVEAMAREAEEVAAKMRADFEALTCDTKRGERAPLAVADELARRSHGAHRSARVAGAAYRSAPSRANRGEPGEPAVAAMTAARAGARRPLEPRNGQVATLPADRAGRLAHGAADASKRKPDRGTP